MAAGTYIGSGEVILVQCWWRLDD